MTEAEALDRLRAFVRRFATQKQAATFLNVSPQYLSDVLNDRREPIQVLKRIGLRRVVRYEEIKEELSVPDERKEDEGR